MLKTASSIYVPKVKKGFFLNSGGMRRLIYLRRPRLNPTNYGNLRENLVMARFLLIDNHVALGIVNVSETIENLILNSILTIYMTLCYRRTVLRSGNVGARSLSTKNIVFKLMAVLILILLLVDFLSILLEHTLIITLPKPIS